MKVKKGINFANNVDYPTVTLGEDNSNTLQINYILKQLCVAMP